MTITGIETTTTTGTPEFIAASIPAIIGIVATDGIPDGIMDGMPTALTIGTEVGTTTGIVAAATEGTTRALAA